MDLDEFRKMPGIEVHAGLREAFGKLWEAVYELQHDRVLAEDATLGLANGDSVENMVSLVESLEWVQKKDYPPAVAVNVHEEWEGDPEWIKEAADKVRSALAKIPGSKPYLAGDSGSAVIIVITAVPDLVMDELLDEQALWVKGLDKDALAAYKRLVREELQPVTDEEKEIFGILSEVHES